MIATYYAIFEFNESSQRRGDIVDEGILSHNEDVIYPGQTTGIKELPSECELHHFKAEGYRIETCNFSITRNTVRAFRLNGDTLIND